MCELRLLFSPAGLLTDVKQGTLVSAAAASVLL